MSEWQNRIVGSDMVPASELMANPHNFRIHPRNQQSALKGGLDEIGWIQEVVVNKRSGNLIDGHLRVTLALREGEDTLVPVKYVDLNENEERLALLTLDPIAAMAATDREQLEALLQDVNTGEAALQEMLAGLAADAGIVPPDGSAWDDAFGGLPDEDKAPFQQMTFTLHDTQVEIVNDAVKKAKENSDFTDTMNENSNGNALAAICEAFING